jgi:DNA-directed RNA polymerase subunit M/transcription elongation factor TFIIS
MILKNDRVLCVRQLCNIIFNIITKNSKIDEKTLLHQYKQKIQIFSKFVEKYIFELQSGYVYMIKLLINGLNDTNNFNKFLKQFNISFEELISLNNTQKWKEIINTLLFLKQITNKKININEYSAYLKKIENDQNENAGSLKCIRCKSANIKFSQRQTRSGDEGMTVYCICANCNFKQKF